MSVEFTNAYQEILLDNLMAIIKQNFMFQTQLKLSENLGKNTEELQKKLNEITELYNSSVSSVSQLEIYKSKAEMNNSAHEEKNRIQSALNEELKKSSTLKTEIEEKNTNLSTANKEIEQLKKQILLLQELVPVTKLKKFMKEVEEPVNVVLEIKTEEKKQYPKIENKIQKILDGSTF